ncbi:tRNA preQ1(34) S-adenosylmethionine ribosyltransferase-isomerase QueA [Desulfuribacillus alkaliarsenatis]|uniref:S-adenosylmethionine:tRNA ribosyltransferase-isomerase n=1 Tax=Desulfuribacillus alkaliarsenatis TaxID=766136 RepID=A0A1E5G1M8_9FIRM|nr:tRNA preQ1(34) S-adenosylmethionine ribosyltransferase-isomerase QueA [Desulfuribacillus alkaliarsenatis]OEF96348.1 tRNA preQ1(34) S-adenosylmethionine ribosyltransferase-isomerase QueA [Desulfuribacillus alkaliarsenatis]
MKVQDFDFYLPEELIAQSPLSDRAGSRLMVVDTEANKIYDKQFADLYDSIKSGDTLVLNDTRVIPARLLGRSIDTGSKIEFLLLKPLEDDRWEILVKPGKKAKVGRVFEFGNGSLKAEIIDITPAGGRIVHFQYNGIFNEILDELGSMPLPPYITEQLEDKERYQTVYSKYRGSVAAPTAGLHFTKEMLDSLQDKGVNIAYVTLHVGLGTFRPVQVDDVEEHVMHSEYYEISKDTADIINRTKASGGRVISVGTTSTRVLETVGQFDGIVTETSGWTDIFIYPGYKFKVVDGLLTNFHLPKSTLIMLVSAFANQDLILKAYEHAVSERYRFFSFGDAMLLMKGAGKNGRNI